MTQYTTPKGHIVIDIDVVGGPHYRWTFDTEAAHVTKSFLPPTLKFNFDRIENEVIEMPRETAQP